MICITNKKTNAKKCKNNDYNNPNDFQNDRGCNNLGHEIGYVCKKSNQGEQAKVVTGLYDNWGKCRKGLLFWNIYLCDLWARNQTETSRISRAKIMYWNWKIQEFLQMIAALKEGLMNSTIIEQMRIIHQQPPYRHQQGP